MSRAIHPTVQRRRIGRPWSCTLILRVTQVIPKDTRMFRVSACRFKAQKEVRERVLANQGWLRVEGWTLKIQSCSVLKQLSCGCPDVYLAIQLETPKSSEN